MKVFGTLAIALLLAACATAPAPQQPERRFDDALSNRPTVRVGAADVFALSPEMRQYLGHDVARLVRTRGRQQALFAALYHPGELKLEYDAAVTRNASEAFAARSGNCLSLVIMTAAFAKALDLPVEYQKVFVDDAWARAGNMYLAIGHVNLVLGKRKTEEASYASRLGKKAVESEGLIIDFLPPEDMRSVRSRIIGEDIVVAMYMNNRAVEALARDRIDDAYWYAREAV